MDLHHLVVCLVILLGVFGCRLTPNSLQWDTKNPQAALFVVTTDYQTGQLARLNLEERFAQLQFANIHSDAVIRVFDSLPQLFIINRLGADNIQRIDPISGITLQQFSVGLGQNPQDLLIEEQVGYVTALNGSGLLRIDLKSGTPLAPLDLSQFADADGFPEATYLKTAQDELAIQLQRLDRKTNFLPTDYSAIVFWDLKHQRWSGEVKLLASNPVTDFKESADGNWLVGEVGHQSRLDGGIEKIDPRTKLSKGFITTEEQLGGDLVDFECLHEHECVAIISQPETSLVTFDPRTGTRLRTLYTSVGYHLQQVLWDSQSETLYVADSNPRDPQIRVWTSQSLFYRVDLNWKLQLPPYRIALKMKF